MERMANRMGKNIGSHLKAVYPITRAGNKRIVSFMADKVTKLHNIGGVVDLLVISKEGEVHSIFLTTCCYSAHRSGSYSPNLQRHVYYEVGSHSGRDHGSIY